MALVEGSWLKRLLDARRLKPRRGPRRDVVFYTPWVGPTLSSHQWAPPGGAETQMLMLARELSSRGHAVAIVAFGTPFELPSDVDGVSIIPRPRPAKVRLVGKVIELLRIWRALSLADAETIVYRGMGFELGILSAYARLRRRRFMFSAASISDFDAGALLSRRDLLLYEYGVRHADAVVVQSHEQVPLCRQKFGREPQLIRSIALANVKPVAAPEAFLWIGRLVAYKGPLAYLDLARDVPEARFWMVGVPVPDPSQRAVVEAVVEQARTIPNLELLAPRPHAELQDLMDRAVASVNTSAFEGMPNVLLEGWARGVPALVFRHDPDGVVCAHNLGGFAEGSAARFAELAREQWRNRYDRQELSERCRRYVAHHHAPEAVAERWVRVLFSDSPPSDDGQTQPRRSACVA